MTRYHFRLLFLALGISLLGLSCSSDFAEIGLDPGQSGSITRFAIHNGFMYALNPNGVQTFSLADRDKPQLLHTLPTDYGLETIIVFDGNIFLGSRTALYILDITDPAAPSILSQTSRGDDLFGGCDPVVVKDNYAYSTVKIIVNVCGNFGAQSALIVYDITNRAAPASVGTYSLNLPNGLGYSGEYLFVCDEGTNKVEIFDITDPLNVQHTELGISITDPIDLIVRGDQLVVSARTEFRFFDISNIEDIRPLGRIGK